MTAPTERPTPQDVIRLHYAPCHECGRPAAALAIFPHGRSVVHADTRAPACTRLATTTTGGNPR